MTVVCQLCKEMIVGGIAPGGILGMTRRAYEFAGLYPQMAQHIGRHHPELTQLITGMMDQFALGLAANVFNSKDPIEYQELHDMVKNAVWAAVNQQWRFTEAVPKIEQ